MAKRAKEKYLVLMVDDSEDDCLLIQMALRQAERLRFIGSVPDGEEVVAYLKGSGKYADREQYPVPDMMLLDLKMPRKTGFEDLEWLNSQTFDDMDVMVVTGSAQAEAVQRQLEPGPHYYHA